MFNSTFTLLIYQPAYYEAHNRRDLLLTLAVISAYASDKELNRLFGEDQQGLAEWTRIREKLKSGTFTKDTEMPIVDGIRLAGSTLRRSRTADINLHGGEVETVNLNCSIVVIDNVTVDSNPAVVIGIPRATEGVATVRNLDDNEPV